MNETKLLNGIEYSGAEKIKKRTKPIKSETKMFSIVSKTLFVVVLVCAFLSCYEARPQDEGAADGTTPGTDTSASGATGSPDATGATATPDPSAGTASPGDASSASPEGDIDSVVAKAESARRK
ncbi:hypothetical protein AVEN_8659-1 [Araneus ventricosus]|uniref:Uncharacterized protein n=1 Tax=Araneus ventricosus TaxID=182803 RepID=A0A4Y2C4T8_ARAVE|nr:hypothetical protein AVEN_8659-1 [Araneus ventricosus]